MSKYQTRSRIKIFRKEKREKIISKYTCYQIGDGGSGAPAVNACFIKTIVVPELLAQTENSLEQSKM